MTIDAAFEEHLKVLTASRQHLVEKLEMAAERLTACLRRGGKVMLCGNGGSAADAQHFAAELVGRYERERCAMAAIALTTDASILTAVGNDYGYEQTFSRQVAALGRPDDLLIAISTSGSSANVVAAAEAARRADIEVVALTGEDGGRLATLADVLLAVPSRRTARIQEMHELCLHALAESVELRSTEPRP